jgi:hypothetical protein
MPMNPEFLASNTRTTPPSSIRPRIFDFPIYLAGEAALCALNGAGEGKVLAVFRRSFYLKTKGGLVCIGPSSIGAGPLNAICQLPEKINWNACGVQQEGRVQSKEGSIAVCGRIDFSFREAQEWRPVSFPSEWKPEDLMLGLSRLSEEAEKRAPSDGLGSLIAELAVGLRVEVSKVKSNDLFLKAAVKGIAALIDWLRDALGENSVAITVPPTEAEELIGLGPGLTPSGDDFIGGTMIALRVFDQTPAAERLADWTIPLAQERTSLISQAHLVCAAQGMGMEALHEMLREVCRPGAFKNSKFLDGVDSIGHTSGWDALAGATAVCAILQAC